MKNLPKLSDREWELMNVCWKKKQLTVQDVIEGSPEDEKRHYQTVKAQLDVLLNKGYLTREKFGPLWLYSPVYSQKEVRINDVVNYVENFAGNYIFPTFVNFIENKKISREELKKLKEMIDKLPLDDTEDKKEGE